MTKIKVYPHMVEGGSGSKLYTISISDCGRVTNNYWLGDNPTDVMEKFFKGCEWDEEFVMNEFCNVGWVFEGEDWEEDDYDGMGCERIEVDEIGEVVE
jgi:hypothetical protein